MRGRDKLIVAGGIVFAGVIGADAYMNRPDKTFYVTMDDGRTARVRRYEEPPKTIVSFGFREELIDAEDDDLVPEIKISTHGEHFYESRSRSPLSEKDKKVFREATEKAGLRR